MRRHIAADGTRTRDPRSVVLTQQLRSSVSRLTRLPPRELDEFSYPLLELFGILESGMLEEQRQMDDVTSPGSSASES